MSKQALVVGLGQFGNTVARALSRRGLEVLAVDSRADLVQAISGSVAEAVCLNALDEAALARTAPAQRDLCICAIGEQYRENAIIVTALLRQLGAPRIIARAGDDLLERILLLVGAHEVVNPERAFGERLATRLIHEGILEEIPLGQDLVISELLVPPALVGRKLTELELPRRFGLTVLGLRRRVEERSTVVTPDPRAPLLEGEILIVVARPGAAQKLAERL